MSLTSVWLLLCGATLLSVALGGGAVAPAGGVSWPVAGLLAVAFFKAWLVLRHFMEVRHAPLWLRRVTDAWALGVPLALLALML